MDWAITLGQFEEVPSCSCTIAAQRLSSGLLMATLWTRTSKSAGEAVAGLEASSMGDTISEPAELTPEGPGSEALVGRGHNLWAGLVAFIFVALLAALYSGILRDLAWQWWDDSNYTHGFLVPIFSGVLVWQRRRLRGAGSGFSYSSWESAFSFWATSAPRISSCGAR